MELHKFGMANPLVVTLEIVDSYKISIVNQDVLLDGREWLLEMESECMRYNKKLYVRICGLDAIRLKRLCSQISPNLKPKISSAETGDVELKIRAKSDEFIISSYRTLKHEFETPYEGCPGRVWIQFTPKSLNVRRVFI